MKKIRVSIVENDRIYLNTLKLVLGNSEDIEIVFTHNTAESALAELVNIKPDVVLFDIELGSPDYTGIDCIMRLKPALFKY